MAEEAERGRMEQHATVQYVETENERLKVELADSNAERVKIKQVVDELVQAEQKGRSEDIEREIEKWKAKAGHFEKEYNQAKQLNNEMTKFVAQMTQAVSERSDQHGDVSKQNKLLQKQLEGKSQELKNAKAERDEVQKQLDSLQCEGSYFKEKHRQTSNELRTLKQEHSVATATASKLRTRVESLQKENEDLKADIQANLVRYRSNASDDGKMEQYESHLRELQAKMLSKDSEIEHSQAFIAKSQAVNDCLNTLLVLESEQTNLYESACLIQDETIKAELDAKKSKASHVIGRLNDIMAEDEHFPSAPGRPSIPYLGLSQTLKR
eukprot:gnl/TRDRNA2_/TRDRNA2_166009_c4_seq1.p1 gnl/TRDRNA2_/TRDRNA2_166009_c4~~gnl/TRDRNA2_/TRDRNA2_166009_c4_seq1.p1  ORF type:complete len:371 (-),score=106.67 gnl/TRDRNA2_/TRDRNA2_166009_c4_seq1:319-1293(-)